MDDISGLVLNAAPKVVYEAVRNGTRPGSVRDSAHDTFSDAVIYTSGQIASERRHLYVLFSEDIRKNAVMDRVQDAVPDAIRNWVAD